jgi:hypothetical protein
VAGGNKKMHIKQDEIDEAIKNLVIASVVCFDEGEIIYECGEYEIIVRKMIKEK